MAATFTEGYSTGTIGAQNYDQTYQRIAPKTTTVGVRRVVSNISFYNASSTTRTITLQKFWGPTPTTTTLAKFQLAAGASYIYTHPIVLLNVAMTSNASAYADYVDAIDSGGNTDNGTMFDATFADITS